MENTRLSSGKGPWSARRNHSNIGLGDPNVVSLFLGISRNICNNAARHIDMSDDMSISQTWGAFPPFYFYGSVYMHWSVCVYIMFLPWGPIFQTGML
jgi:hypothetical protein